MKTAATVLSLCLMMSFTAWSQAISNDITESETSELSTTSEVYIEVHTGVNDTVAVLNAEQLRTTALIFAEHEFLKKENALLKEQVSALQQSLAESKRMITDYRTAIRELETNYNQADKTRQALTDSYREQLRQQKKKTRRRTIWYTAGGIVAGIIIGTAVGS